MVLAREDRAARLVLSTPEAWDWLSTEDHELLGHLPEPHGPLLAWLEAKAAKLYARKQRYGDAL